MKTKSRARGVLAIGVGVLLPLLTAARWPAPRAALAESVLWSAPSPQYAAHLADGPGGTSSRPQPPFRFLKEDTGGTNPKVQVRDGRGRVWIVKWGPEVNAEAFASRLAWAAGYFSPPVHYVPSGQIIGATHLKRAQKFIEDDGRFREARFKMIMPEYRYLSDRSWSWIDNPFLATPSGRRELNGLKILLMLTSNWDAKDNRDPEQGSNTAIFTRRVGGRVKYIYAFDDWGSTMGKWGGFFGREKWDCEGYVNQTPDFVKGVEDGYVEWGFTGKHTKDVTAKIPLADVAWMAGILSRIPPRQIHEALVVSGATPIEARCFTDAVVDRIGQLRRVARER